MKIHAIVLVLFLALAGSINVFAAEPLYPGGPTIGDINRENFAKLIMARQQAAAAAAEFNESIHAARRRFFTTAAKSAQHRAAEKEFASELRGKDFFFLGPCITNGFSDGMTRLTAVSFLTAGHNLVDGGIQRQALPAFGAWVNAIRRSLGARSESQLLVVGLDSDAVTAAIDANVDAYAAYKRERDKAEFAMWSAMYPDEIEISGPPPPEETMVLHVRLMSQGLYLVKYTEAKIFPVESGIRGQMDPGDQQILVCIYGLVSTTEYARLFPRKYYWYKNVPKNIQQLHEVDSRGFKGLLGMPDQAYESCPETADGTGRQFAKAAAFYGPTDLSYADEQALYLRTACHFAAIQTLEKEEGDFANMLYNQVEQRYTGICMADKANLTATKVSGDLHGMCSGWNTELTSIRQSRPSPKSRDAAVLGSYDRQCKGTPTVPVLASAQGAAASPGAGSVAGSTQTSSAATPTAATTGPQDAQAGRCAQMFNDLATARARAKGLREIIGVKSMESAVYRQCGKP